MPPCRRRASGLALLSLSLLPCCAPNFRGPERATPPAGDAARPGASSATATRLPSASPRPGTDSAGGQEPPRAGSPATAPAGGPPASLIERAEGNASRGDLEEAARLLEMALKAVPEDRRALLLLAQIDQARASELDRPESSPVYRESARAIRRLADTYKDLNPAERECLAISLYNEACTDAIEGRKGEALEALARSIAAGFARTDLFAEDPELAPLRKSPRFAELTRDVERNARVQAGQGAGILASQTRPFAFRFSLPNPGGKVVSLDDLKGTVTIVDLWGTWCPPCRREIPHLKALLAKYREKGLAIVGINYERVADEDVGDTVGAFVREQAVPYPCLIGDQKTLGQIPHFSGYPTLLFLDRSGDVRIRVEGYRPLVDLEACVELVLRESSRPQPGVRSPDDSPSREGTPGSGDRPVAKSN